MGLPFLLLFVAWSNVCVFYQSDPLIVFHFLSNHYCTWYLSVSTGAIVFAIDIQEKYMFPYLLSLTHMHIEASMVGGYDINPPMGPGSLITHTPVGSVSLSQLLLITTSALSFYPLQFLTC